MIVISKIDAWHKTRPGLLLFSLCELGIAYGFASLSIDRGNLWWYLFTVIFFIGTLKNFIQFIGTFIHG